LTFSIGIAGRPYNSVSTTVLHCDAAAAAATVSDVHVSAPGSSSASTPTVTADSIQSKETVNTFTSVEPPAATIAQANPIITKNSSSFSILQQLCSELSLDPPAVEVSKSPSLAYGATVSIKYGFTSLKSYAKKLDAQEEAAHVALLSLKTGNVEHDAKNCRTQLNEYCQRQQREKPEYVPSGSGPFSCTVFVPIVHTVNDMATEAEATVNAARGILTTLGRTSHFLQVIDDPRFETFSVSCNPYTLTTRYRFGRHSAGQTTKKNAEKVAAERALSVLYPELDPKPGLDQCKNKLQELYPQETPKYLSESEDGLFYSEVTVSFMEQITSTNLSPLSASDDLAKRVLKRLDLIS